jgi:hypothetical protein
MIALLLLLSAAPPQGEAPRIRTTLDTARVTLGDRLHLRVVVTHAPGQRVRWPDSLALAPFEILARRASPPARNGDAVADTLALTLAAFELGRLTLPSFGVTVEGGAAPDTLLTDGWTVTVESVGGDSTADIRDVKGPLSMPRNWLSLAVWIAGGLVAAALAYRLYRRFGRRGAAPAPAPVLPPRPPHVIAYEALAALERSPLLEQGLIKEYYDRASDIVRRYFEGRYHVSALEMATGEVLGELALVHADETARREAAAFLETCDLVKFAKLTPPPEASRVLVSAARHIVDLTREAEPAAVASGTGT